MPAVRATQERVAAYKAHLALTDADCSVSGRIQQLGDALRALAPYEAALRQADTAPAVIRLRPNAADIYRRQVEELEIALASSDIRAEAGEALQSLIEHVVLTPDTTAHDGLAVDLHGDLTVILSLASQWLKSATGDNETQAACAEYRGSVGYLESTIVGCGDRI